MQCPPVIAQILLEIIQFGILQTRASGWNGDAKRCAIEADHIHNLPCVITSFSWQRLDYYWSAERVWFADNSSPADMTVFQPLWERLESAMKSMEQTIS